MIHLTLDRCRYVNPTAVVPIAALVLPMIDCFLIIFEALFACCHCEFIGWNSTLTLVINLFGLIVSSGIVQLLDVTATRVQIIWFSKWIYEKAVQLCGSDSKLYDTRNVQIEKEDNWCGETLERWFREGVHMPGTFFRHAANHGNSFHCIGYFQCFSQYLSLCFR